MKAVALIPKRLEHGVAFAFGRVVAPILSVRLEAGEERLAAEVGRELMASGAGGKIVTVHTEAQVAAAGRELEAEAKT